MACLIAPERDEKRKRAIRAKRNLGSFEIKEGGEDATYSIWKRRRRK